MLKMNIDTVVAQNLCVGCGVCTLFSFRPLKMVWNIQGFLVPQIKDSISLTDNCIKVCPFNPQPAEEVRTENELADFFLKGSLRTDERIGKYLSLYAGYSTKYRLASSSGGLATYVLSQLLEEGVVNHVVAVKSGKQTCYEYAICDTVDDMVTYSKTKYYPVTLSSVLQKLKDLEGAVAITAVPCFVKALRLLQYYNPFWKTKIKFLVGIICGGMKSTFFTEYCAMKTGVPYNSFTQPLYRIKDLLTPASDYSFGCLDQKERLHTVNMRRLGDMWGTGLFKNFACECCDDVLNELADISLGDAWIPPYCNDGKGYNVIITRSLLADKLIRQGIIARELVMETLPASEIIRSQQGSFNHRWNGLAYRYQLFRHEGMLLPPKRHANIHINFFFKKVQFLRLQIRQSSMEYWNDDPEDFDENMKPLLKKLDQATKCYHKFRNLRSCFHL